MSEELFESLIELQTPVCASVADAERELRRLRAHGLAIAAAEGLRLGSAGTHPFSLFERQRVTGRERYRALVDDLQYAARRELVFGMHVHVAVDDPDRAVRVVGALQAHLGELVALSASSPFWRGEPTGLASCRHLIFSAFPRSGRRRSFAAYEEFADDRRRARRVRLHRRLHADLVGREAASALRHGRGAGDGRREPRRGCRRADRVRAGARRALRRRDQAGETLPALALGADA